MSENLIDFFRSFKLKRHFFAYVLRVPEFYPPICFCANFWLYFSNQYSRMASISRFID